jgi:hypothetical protein
MALPSYYISSSVTTVDTETTSKILMLPPARSIEGATLYIYDLKGMASVNPIYVSTQQGDLMDNDFSTIIMDTNYQSLRIAPFFSSRYAICQSYTGGLDFFTLAPRVGVYFLQRAFQRNWAAFATDTGTNQLAVTNGGTSQGFYSSSDNGQTWNYIVRNEIFVDCAIGRFGGTWYAVSTGPSGAGGYIYRSQNEGASWVPVGDNDTGPQIWVAIDCDNDGGVVYAITSNDVWTSGNAGENWTSRAFTIPAGTYFTDIALAGNYSAAYITTSNAFFGDGIYVSRDKLGATWDLYGPTLTGWIGVTTNDGGTTAYATTAVGEIYKSTDTGSNWSLINSFYGWIKPRCSLDGSTLYGLDNTGQQLYKTTDGGTTFTTFGDPRAWITQYGCNQSGEIFVGGVSGGYIYNGQNIVL